MPMGQRPQEGVQGRRSPDLTEHDLVAGVPQPVEVLDRVRPGDHPGQQQHHLGHRVRPSTICRARDRHMLRDQLRQADLLGQSDHRHQPRIRNQIRVIEHDINHANRRGRLHLAGVPSNRL
jgi:hypothetical protein